MQDKFKREINWLLEEKYNSKYSENYHRLIRTNKPINNKSISSKIEKDIERIKAGEPLDYVIGFVNFLGCKIDLSQKTLIPRPETEFWVLETVNKIKKTAQHDESIMALDLFSGSGCIGLSLLKNIENSKVYFADSEDRAIKQIKINCKLNKINTKRFKIIKSDIFKNINNVKFDYIFANPPYISKDRSHVVQKSVLLYEPKEAIFGGKDGLFYIDKFLKDSKKFLKEKGKIYMEFDSSSFSIKGELDSMQKNQIEELLKKYKYSNCKFHKDQYKRWRWVEIM